MKRNDDLIKSNFYKYLLPGIMMVAAMQLGNLVDSIFVGNLLGSDALAAINIAIPFVFIAQAPLMILAVGGSTVASICLGKRAEEEASKVFTITFVFTMIIHVINALAAMYYCNPLAQLLAGDGNLSHMASIFMKVNIIGMPLMGFGIFISYFMSVDNHPFESAALHILANIINLVTDWLYIKVLHMGIAGSALSTVTGYGISGIIFVIWYCCSRKRMLHLCFHKALPIRIHLTDCIRNGLSAGLMLLMSAVKLLVLNSIILKLTGEDGMGIYAVCTNSFFLVQLCLHGVVGVIQTIAGVLYGEKDYYGIRGVLNRVIIICTGIAILLILLFALRPDIISTMFGFDRPLLEETMNQCLRIYAVSFLFYAYNTIMQTYYSTIEKAFLATINTLLQGLFLLLPVTIVLLPYMGVLGTSAASVIAEVGAFFIVFLVRKYMQHKGELPGDGYAVLPKEEPEKIVDISIHGTQHEAAGIAHSLREKCLQNGISAKTSNIVAIAGEELVDNIAVHGSQKRNYIDLCVVKGEGNLILRVRDDGPLFNPLEYKRDEEEAEDVPEITGLKLIQIMAEKLDYTRVLNMNNTIVEVAIEKVEDSI